MLENTIITLLKKDNRKTYYVVLDVEACNTNTDKRMSSSLVYDLGYAIIDKEGNVYKTENLVISDIYKDEAELMKSAYYADKLPRYEVELKDGTRKMVTIYTARKLLHNDCKEYNVKAIIAHNGDFDCRALNNTIRYLSNSRIRYFYPYGVALWDSMYMARDTICKQTLYKRFCEEKNYLDRYGKPRKTAEMLYQFISGEEDFQEAHTGLEDVMIEKEIFLKCLRQHKAMRRLVYQPKKQTMKEMVMAL